MNCFAIVLYYTFIHRLANLLDMIKPFATLTTTKRLDQIEAKLEEIIKVINQQQSP